MLVFIVYDSSCNCYINKRIANRRQQGYLMVNKEVCTNCQSEITEFEQAYLFQGNVVCQLCDQSLRPSPVSKFDEPLELSLQAEDVVASAEVPPPVYQRPQISPARDWDLATAKRNRTLYLTFFILMIIGNGITMGTAAGVLLYLPALVLFLIFFLRTAKMVGGYSTLELIGIGIGAFIPVISLIVLGIVDVKLYKSIRGVDGKTTPSYGGPREFSSMSLYSLLLVAFPYIGLPLAFFAIRRISNSQGRLYGRKLAIISLTLNLFALAFLIFIIIMAILDDPAAATG
jgi:hypothetical protein